MPSFSKLGKFWFLQNTKFVKLLQDTSMTSPEILLFNPSYVVGQIIWSQNCDCHLQESFLPLWIVYLSSASYVLDYFYIREIGLDFSIHHFWSHWIITSQSTYAPISPAAVWKLHDSSTRWSLHSDKPGMFLVQPNPVLRFVPRSSMSRDIVSGRGTNRLRLTRWKIGC